MTKDEQKIVRTMQRVSRAIYENARRDGKPALLACSRRTWKAFGFAPEEYDAWMEAGKLPARARSGSEGG